MDINITLVVTQPYNWKLSAPKAERAESFKPTRAARFKRLGRLQLHKYFQKAEVGKATPWRKGVQA